MTEGTIGDCERTAEIPPDVSGTSNKLAIERPLESAFEVPEDTLETSSGELVPEGLTEEGESVPEDVPEASSADTPDDTFAAVPEDAPESDTPGEADHLSDSQRAMENLADFKPENWEQLSLDEKKHSIEGLADSNADILGLQHRPRIDYYADDSSGDYGSYSGEGNSLAMNECNLSDGPETADTVAHELRHAYQYEHAQNPTSQQDLLFRENFDHYVAPEQDYAGYKDQTLESDARDYAQQFRERVST